MKSRPAALEEAGDGAVRPKRREQLDGAYEADVHPLRLDASPAAGRLPGDALEFGRRVLQRGDGDPDVVQRQRRRGLHCVHGRRRVAFRVTGELGRDAVRPAWPALAGSGRRAAPAGADEAGRLGRAALEALDAAATELAGFDATVYVVCHVVRAGDAETAIAHSSRCAEQAARHLQAAGVEAASFGAGPLLPRPDAPLDRVELVLP